MEKFTKKTMEAYAELVRLLGDQACTVAGNTFYWYLAFDDCSDIGIVVEFFTKDNNPVIQIYDSMDIGPIVNVINQDVIHSIIGYACNMGIELKHNEYLHINEKSNNKSIS